MSSLLLLADIASKDYCTSKSIEIGVQTDVSVDECHNNDFSASPVLPCVADISLFETERSGHDYIKQNDFDILVNANHDYYNRITQNDDDLEHSYAFSVVQSFTDADCSAPVNNYNADDVFLEGIANLDEHMGIQQTGNGASGSSVFEEIVQDDFVSSSSSSTNNHLENIELEPTLISDVQKMIEENKLHFDDILRYVNTEEEELHDEHEQINQESFGIYSNEIINNNNNETPEEVTADSAAVIDCLWDNCCKQFDNSQHLISHLREQHIFLLRRTKPYFCKWRNCSRKTSFSERYLLERHLRTHTFEKPFQCDVCKKTFASKCRLDCHTRRHKGVKPFTCKTCGKKFAASGDYCRHIKIHDPNLNYLCHVCNKQYKDDSGLRKHQKICSKTKKDNCEYLQPAGERSNVGKQFDLNRLPKWLKSVARKSSEIIVIKL